MESPRYDFDSSCSEGHEVLFFFDADRRIFATIIHSAVTERISPVVALIAIPTLLRQRVSKMTQESEAVGATGACGGFWCGSCGSIVWIGCVD